MVQRLLTPFFAGLLILFLLLSPLEAQARGGRYSHASAAPAPASQTEDPDAAESPETVYPKPPSQQPEAPTVRTPAELSGSTLRGRRGAMPGRTTWTWWYEAHREKFEDLRARHLLTAESASLFGVGEAIGPAPKPPRLDRNARAALLVALKRVLTTPKQHWIHTEAAALVALGKVAEGPSDLQWHFELLHPSRQAEAYLRESAVLGFANLRRIEKDERLAAGLLDRVRTLLVRTLDDESYRPKTRGHAAHALALLADQPSVHGERTGSWTADRLFDTWLDVKDPNDELRVGILIGLARLAPKDVKPVARLALAACAEGRKDERTPQSGLARAHAAITLARIGVERDAKIIAALIGRTKGEPALVGQGAAIAAAILGERLPATRGALGRDALAALPKHKEPGTRRQLLLAIGRLLAAEARSGGGYLLEDSKGDQALLRILEKGSVEERPFAAIALAQALRATREEIKTAAWQGFRRRTTTALRKAFDEANGDGRLRGGFAAALGIAGDGNSTERLLSVLRDEDRAPELRAHAALGLGLLGDSRRKTTNAVIAALKDPRSDLLQCQAATALGLMGERDLDERARLLEVLLKQLRQAQQHHVKAQIAITLGRMGDKRAVAPLIRMLEDRKAPHLDRAMACAGLGLLGEEALHPALGKSRWDSHYLSSSALVMDILDVL